MLKDQELDFIATHCVWRRGIWSCNGVSLWRPGFNPKPVHVGFVVDKVALGEWFLLILVFFPISITTQSQHLTLSLNKKLKNRDVGNNNMAYKVAICPPRGLYLNMP